MRPLLASMIMAALPVAALADTTLIDTGKLPTKEVYGIAELTPLAVSSSGTPTVVLLDLEAGDVVPPHATKSHLRLLTVLSGDLSWGEGGTIDQARENVYPAGSVLTVPSGHDHWLAARNGPLRIQLIVLDDQNAVPGIQEQMK